MPTQNYDELLDKAKEWREWYYDGTVAMNPVTEPVQDAFELINATLFGHIYQRPTLDGKTRSICTIAALVARDKPDQLAGHITGALFYGGYPAAVNAMNAAAKAFEDYDKRHANDQV